MAAGCAANVLVNLGEGGNVTRGASLLPGTASGGTEDRSLSGCAPPCFFRHGLGLHKGMARERHEGQEVAEAGVGWWASAEGSRICYILTALSHVQPQAHSQ